ncbi:hypothetical protein [Spirillospora sp. CA-128828]|uniref:hypothetical protein n=1 Tax=Spirillospora sp. CA-128828 TaxID=3240033 RepID=UPI003D8C717C
MGLQRPIEPFHRPYAGPEPPAPARRPRKTLAMLVGAVVFAVAAGTVFLLAPGRRGHEAAPVTAARPSGPASPGQVITALPAPCGTVSAATVERTVPKAQPRQRANSTLTTCTYTTAGSASRWLRVEAHLYVPDGTVTPVQDAEGYYDAQWAQAHDASPARTISLDREPGIGDEAYHWSKADDGEQNVVGQVTARTRNAVFTVSYGERAPGRAAQDEREPACLVTAAAVAREVLGVLNRF